MAGRSIGRPFAMRLVKSSSLRSLLFERSDPTFEVTRLDYALVTDEQRHHWPRLARRDLARSDRIKQRRRRSNRICSRGDRRQGDRDRRIPTRRSNAVQAKAQGHAIAFERLSDSCLRQGLVLPL